MTGIIGFIFAALSIGAFGAIVFKGFPYAKVYDRQAFGTALTLLAAAMALWAVTLAFNTARVTEVLFIATDILMALATVTLLSIILPKTPAIWASLAALVAVAAGYRAVFMPITAVISDGILYFNLAGGLRQALLGSLLFVWLPIMMVLAFRFTAAAHLRWARPVFIFLYVNLVTVTALFLSARRQAVIIGLFSYLVLLFLTGAVFSRIISRLHPLDTGKHIAAAKKGGKHATRSTAA